MALYHTTVFSAAGLRGNAATVMLLAGAPSARLTTDLLSSADASHAICVAWPEHDAVAVRCYQRGRMIGFCGHGLLAVANVFFLRTGKTPWLQTCVERYASFVEQDCIWLRAPRLRCHRTALPPRCRHWFGNTGAGPCRSAIAGGAQGYRILEWPGGADLAALKPDLGAISRDESRSVIVTQAAARVAAPASNEQQQTWDFSLRYFAPQYGVPEDSATGSANVVLADYWNGRGLQGRNGANTFFHAQQCSREGGAVMSRLQGSFVEIGGHFHVIETTSDRFNSTGFSAAAGS